MAGVLWMVVQSWTKTTQLFETKFDRFSGERQLVERVLQSEMADTEVHGFGVAAGSEMSILCTEAAVVKLGTQPAALDQHSLYTVVEVEHPGTR
jgi:hypothetical protein